MNGLTELVLRTLTSRRRGMLKLQGQRLTVADISLACSLSQAFQKASLGELLSAEIFFFLRGGA